MAQRGGAPGGTRQRKHWHGTTNTPLIVAANSTNILSTLVCDASSTVLREIGSCLVAFDDTGVVAADAVVFTFGLGIFSSDAVAVGASAMPDPDSEPEFDWLWWYSVQMYAPQASASGNVAPQARIDIASKAMRRCSHSETIALIGQYVDIVGAPTLNVFSSLRILTGE